MSLEIVSTSQGECISAPIRLDQALFDRVLANIFSNISESSQRIYRQDAQQFADWLTRWELTVATVSYEDLSFYRAELARQYTNKVTAARKLTVAKKLVAAAVYLGMRQDDPTLHLKGFKTNKDGAGETPHRALSREEARALLAAIDTSTLLGKRDYALVMLLIRTGLRRAEAAALTLGDLAVEQGHHIARIRHGKGDKPRTVKLPVDVLRKISDYLEATNRKQAGPAAPLFVAFRRGDHPSSNPMTGLAIERVVVGYAQAAGLKGLTPHGLRASFVTLALEGGAKLEQVQYAAGHADPRTTERYQRRKLNLDNNAVDFIKL